MILGYKNYQDYLLEQKSSILGQYNGIDTVMNKIAAYSKCEMAYLNYVNESRYVHHKPVQDIFFTNEEIQSTKELYKEFIPHITESFINELCEAGINVDETIFEELGISNEINEALKIGEKFKKTLASVSSRASAVADKVGGIIGDTKEFIYDNAQEIKKTSEDVRKKILEKYKNIIEFINKIIDIGAKSVSDFISQISKLFEKLGDCISEALSKLGAFKKSDDEDEADIKIDNELIGDEISDEDEKSFFKHVIAYMSIMMASHKDRVDKLISEGFDNLVFDFDVDELNEGKIMDKIANNKFIQFIFCYGKDRKISIWRSILISIVGSLIISFGLPVILSVCGASAAVIPVCCAAARTVWSAKGCFKIILNRYVNKKPGEKLFDTKTCILLLICILPQIPPFKDWISNAFAKCMKWLGLDKWIDNLEESLGKLIGKLHGSNPSIETINKTWEETINDGGGHVSFTDWQQNNSDLLQHAKDSGSSEKALAGLRKLLDSAKEIKGSMKIHDVWNNTLEEVGNDLNRGFIIDSNVAGTNGLIGRAMKNVAESGDFPEMTSGRIGGEVFHGITKRFAGAAPFLYNCTDEAKDAILKEFTNLGGNVSDLHITEFGNGIAQNIVSHSETITISTHWLMNTLTASFSPQFYPMLDKKKWGKYKMRFSSGTRGAAAYVVDRVEMKKGDEIEADENATALKNLKKLHQSAWEDFKKNNPDMLYESLFKKKVKDKEKDDEKKETVKEPQYIVFYIRANEKTGNKSDELDKNKDKDKKPKVAIGIVVDTLTMLAADVCNFNSSVSIRRRPNPYFMKGLFSRLSFRPLENNDNDTKDYIRSTLGKTMGTLVQQNILYGAGRKYISSDIDDKNGKFKLRETILGTDKKFDPNKEIFELGNFSPNELLECINDEGETNKTAYDFFSGKFGSNVSIKTDLNGDIKKASVSKNNSTIENIKYYRVSSKEHKSQIESWEESVKKWEDAGKPGKKPTKPSYIKGEDGEFYKRASKKFMMSNKRKKYFDFVDLKIVPLLKKGKLHDELADDKNISKILFDENYKVKSEVIEILKPFLFRPETTFAKDDEHKLADKIKNDDEGKFKWLKKIFKKPEMVHDTFKKMVEMIWDYMSEERRKIFKDVDFKKPHGKTEEIPEHYTTLYDELIEEFINDEYDEDTEYKYDMMLLENQNPVLSFEQYWFENK